jgi:DNA-binding response OmpR family regulator
MVIIKPNFFDAMYSNPSILIIEDDEDTRQMMKYLLQIWKYQVVEATGSEEEILQMAANYCPNLILISSRNRKDDNFATIKRLRERFSAKTGIIFISGFSEPSTRDSAIAAGADGYLLKPIDFRRLETMLESCLKKDIRRQKSVL